MEKLLTTVYVTSNHHEFSCWGWWDFLRWKAQLQEVFKIQIQRSRISLYCNSIIKVISSNWCIIHSVSVTIVFFSTHELRSPNVIGATQNLQALIWTGAILTFDTAVWQPVRELIKLYRCSVEIKTKSWSKVKVSCFCDITYSNSFEAKSREM